MIFFFILSYYYDSTLIISNNYLILDCLFFGCKNSGPGGSIYGTMLQLKIEYSTFYDSYASKYGGVLHVSNSNSFVEINYCCFNKYNNDHNYAGKLAYTIMSIYLMNHCSIHSSDQTGGYELMLIEGPSNSFNFLNWTFNNCDQRSGIISCNLNNNFNTSFSTFFLNTVIYILQDYPTSITEYNLNHLNIINNIINSIFSLSKNPLIFDCIIFNNNGILGISNINLINCKLFYTSLIQIPFLNTYLCYGNFYINTIFFKKKNIFFIYFLIFLK